MSSIYLDELVRTVADAIQRDPIDWPAISDAADTLARFATREIERRTIHKLKTARTPIDAIVAVNAIERLFAAREANK